MARRATRRSILATAAASTMLAALPLTAHANQADKQMTPNIPQLKLAFTAWFEIGPPEAIGETPGGASRVIPITGGWFKGERLNGDVMAGGSDWQTTRPDGVTVLEARYGLKTDDGAILNVHNHVLVRTGADGQRIIRGQAAIIAPSGPYGWLNKSVFVTTLNDPGDDTAPVVIRYFEVI